MGKENRDLTSGVDPMSAIPPTEGVRVPTSAKFTPEQTVVELDRIFLDPRMKRRSWSAVRLPVSRGAAINASFTPEARLREIEIVTDRVKKGLG